MPTFDFTSPDGKTYSVAGPDGATQDQAFAILQSQLGGQQQPNAIMDAIKGIPRNLLAGVMDAATAGAQAEAHAMSKPDLAAEIPNTQQTLPDSLYKPQTSLGQIVGSGARMLTNPASYVGPGSIPLKIAGAALSGAGSEAAGQATVGSP